MKEVEKFLKEDLLPKLLQNKQKIVKEIVFEESPDIGTDHFTSHNHFATLIFTDETGKEHEKKVIVKSQSLNPQFREATRSVDQFYNEVFVYNRILPYFIKNLEFCLPHLVQNLCPEDIMSHFDDQKPEHAVIILENLKISGFRPSDSFVYLDLKHCQMAMEKIAQFHAISLGLKLKDKDNFLSLTKSFKETKFTREPNVAVSRDRFYKEATALTIDYLKENPTDIPQEFLEKLRKETNRGMESLWELIQPKEPFAVICHGDFCRNNVLFKYNGSEVIDMKLIDFQTTRYGSPALDLAFFLFMNTSYDFRCTYLDDLLKLYYKTLIETILKINPCEDIQSIYSYEGFLADFSDHCLIGYFICSFFIPLVMFEGPRLLLDDFEEDFVTRINNASGTKEKMNDKSRSHLIGIVTDLYKRNYHFGK